MRLGFFSEDFTIPTSVSLHRCLMLIHSSVTDGSDINIRERERERERERKRERERGEVLQLGTAK